MLYHVIVRNDRTGEDTRMTSPPLPHHEAVTVRSKLIPDRTARPPAQPRHPRPFGALMLNLERHAAELAQDAIGFLPPSPRVTKADTRQARGAIACADYANARLLLDLESHRGALGDALGGALCDLRDGRPARAYSRLLGAMLAREEGAADGAVSDIQRERA